MSRKLCVNVGVATLFAIVVMVAVCPTSGLQDQENHSLSSRRVRPSGHFDNTKIWEALNKLKEHYLNWRAQVLAKLHNNSKTTTTGGTEDPLLAATKVTTPVPTKSPPKTTSSPTKPSHTHQLQTKPTKTEAPSTKPPQTKPPNTKRPQIKPLLTKPPAAATTTASTSQRQSVFQCIANCTKLLQNNGGDDDDDGDHRKRLAHRLQTSGVSSYHSCHIRCIQKFGTDPHIEG